MPSNGWPPSRGARCRRDVGHLVRRVHVDPGREAAPAAPPGDRAGQGDRRPVSRRRPLRRRLRDGQRAVAVRGQPGRDERDAAGRGVPRRCLARRVARAARGDAAVAVRVAAPAGGRAVLAAGLAGARLRRDRRRRSSASAAGATPTSTRRSGCRRAAPRRRGRWSATGSTAGRRTRRPGRTSTSSTRSCGSSTGGCATSANGIDDEPAVVWFERDYAEPEAFPEAWPGRWRAADAYPHPATMIRPFLFEGGRRRSAGRLVERGPVARGVDTYRHHATVGTRGSLSWGAGGIPNGLARDLRPDEAMGPAFTSDSPGRAALDPRRAGRDPPPGGGRAGRDRRASGWPTWRRTGPRPG